MKINFITGSADTDKSDECLEIIENIKQSEPNASVFVIVPEQFSYTAEKLVNVRFGGTGLNGIEVLTFSQMTKRFLNRFSGNYLSPAGKAILILKALYSVKNGNNVYSGCADKAGFVKSISEMIAEFKRYMITPAILKESASHMPEKMLRQKLMSAAEIYEEYEKLRQGKFIDSDDDLITLSQAILTEGFFDNSYIFIDEFSDFLPKHYKVIESLMIKCKNMYITLGDGFGDENLSKIPNTTKDKIKLMAKKHGYTTETVCRENDKVAPVSKEIAFLKRNIFKRSPKPYREKTEDIEVFDGADPYSEIEYAARRIKWLVEKENYRYSDIALVCGECDRYAHIISAVFDDYKIPYFSDMKLNITDHPIIMTVLSLFDIINENWSYDAVFRYLKSGYVFTKENDTVVPLDIEDIDFLENYVLKYGIRGKKKWLSDKWEYKVQSISEAADESEIRIDEEKNERLNNIKNTVTEPIVRFLQKVKGRRRVSELACALFEFFTDINLYDGICKEVGYFNSTSRRNEAEQFSKVWNLLIEAMDSLVAAIGDEQCSKEQFCRFLTVGLEEFNIDIIPSSLDSVTVSGADSARQKSVKALIITGAIRGEVPNENISVRMFSDRERQEFSKALSEYSLQFGANTDDLKNAAIFKFYSVLFNAKNKIIVTCPLNDFNGDARVKAQFISELSKLFPQISKYDSQLYAKETVYSVKDAFSYLLDNRNNKNNPNVSGLYRWFAENDSKKLNVIKNADSYKTENAKITPQNANALYADYQSYSVSRINEFSQCPFMFFVKNGLKAKEQEVWQIQKFDLGSLMHYAVCEYCKAVEDGAVNFETLRNNWLALSDEKSNHIIDAVMVNISKRVIAVVERDEGKMKYLLMRMTKTLKRSASLIKESLVKGEYASVEHEKVFNIKIEDCGINLRGCIDRIDLALFPEKNKAGLRIVDYKSGKKDVSVISLSNMIDIQLVVYAYAAVEMYRNSDIRYSDKSLSPHITGIMYNKLRDDLEKVSQTDEGNKMKLSGYVIVENSDDTEEVRMMDKEIEPGEASGFLPVKLRGDNTFASTSKVMDYESFAKVEEYIKENIKEAYNAIHNGNIKVYPYRGNKLNACTYCEMSDICMFDEEKDDTRILCESETEAWEKIEKTIQNKKSDKN